jgi:hypothetical protein
MDASTTLSYLLPTESPALWKDQSWPQPKLVVASPREVDAATNEYNAADVDNEFTSHFAKLSVVASEKTLWPEGADPPSRSAVIWARSVLRQMQAESIQPTRVVASAEGGVAICFINGNLYSDIECLNTGTILGVTTNRRDRPIVWEIEHTPHSIAQACAKVRQFLRGPSACKDVSTRPKRG